ncbi:MAG: hypothetical protein KBD53_05290 [Candidatus Omnitrophica bacterium]|nr:hypothetical protein [Candidatus Omnitrophota bacterium]
MKILRPINNEKGVVLITVVVVIIMILMLVMALRGMNVSQTLLTEDEYKRLQNQLLAESTVAYIYATQQNHHPPMSAAYTINLNGLDHDVEYEISSGGLYGSNLVQIDVTY